MVHLAHDTAGVTLAEHAERVRAAHRAMAERGLDAMLIVSPENIYYLVGLDHQGYFAFTMLILNLEADPVLVSRAMERSTVAAQVPGCVHEAFEDDEDPTDAAIRTVSTSTPAGSRVGVELDTMFFPPRIWGGLTEKITDVEWADGSGIIEQLRAVKSPTELTWVRAAALASDEAMRAGIEAARPGVSEREVAAAVYHQLVLSGSEYPGFAPLIRSNGNLLQEHVTWSGRRLAAGDMLFAELSASVRRYHAPLSRMVHFDRLPPGTGSVAEIALGGLEGIREHLRPGAVVADVYDAWQRVVDEGLGHKLYRRHHCGYAVGIGYPPSWVGGSTVVGIRRGGNFVVREGMVFHVLSWIIGQQPADYVVSDTALVTSEGCELLTATPREPLVLLAEPLDCVVRSLEMRITGLRATPLAVPFREDELWAFGGRGGMVAILLEVTTDEGVVGLGEAAAYPSADVVLAVLRSIEPFVVGEEPFRIERIMKRINVAGTWHHVKASSPAIAAVEMACWDIVGKVCDQPLVNLFGGRVRDRVDFLYYLSWRPPGEIAENVKRGYGAGFRTFYLKVGSEDPNIDIERIEAVRDAGGPDALIRVDANEAWSAGEAVRVVRSMERVGLELVEQPVSGRNLTEMAYVRGRISTPLLANEASWTRYDQLEVIRHGAADVISVDNQMDSGLLNLKRSAGMCEAAGLPVLKHSLGELGIAVYAAVHAMASTPNFLYASQSYASLLSDDIVDGGALPYSDGALSVPERPGIGVRVDRDRVARYADLYQREGQGFVFSDAAALARTPVLPKR